MCLPAAAAVAAGTIASAAGTLTSAYAAQQGANASAEFQNRRYGQVATEANRAYADQIRQIGVRSDQEDASTAEQSFNNMLSGQRAESQVRITTGERGIGGNSVKALQAQFAAMTARNESNLQLNRAWRRTQSLEEMKAARAGAQSRIAQAAPQPVQNVSPFAIALSLLNTAASGYTNMLEVNKRLGN